MRADLPGVMGRPATPRTSARARLFVSVDLLRCMCELRGALAAGVLPALLGLAACGAGGAGDGSERPLFSRADSAGIVILTTRGERAHAPLGWEIDSVPDLVIGTEETGYLHQLQGIKGLPDGSVILLDGGSQEIRFFDAHGRLVKRAGRAGAGPGEFRDPVLVPWPASDSLLIFDRGLLRSQVFSQDGEFGRTIRYVQRLPSHRRQPIGALDAHRLVLEPGEIVGGWDALRRPGLVQMIRRYVLYDSEIAETIALDSFTISGLYNPPGSGLVIPFSWWPVVAVSRDGVLLSFGPRAEIRDYGRDGRLRRI